MQPTLNDEKNYEHFNIMCSVIFGSEINTKMDGNLRIFDMFSFRIRGQIERIISFLFRGWGDGV